MGWDLMDLIPREGNGPEKIGPIYTITSKRAFYQWGEKNNWLRWKLLLLLIGIWVLPMGVKYFTGLFLQWNLGWFTGAIDEADYERKSCIRW